jgi:RNA polymerase sigma-70 factor (ECF subfamily)
LLEKIFKKEKPSTREIAVMHFVDGLTFQEVADEIGLSISGVRKRIRQFRSRVMNKREIYYDK